MMKKHLPIILIFLFSMAILGINLFGFPAVHGDEGVYVGQAWWLIDFGKIAPYTYWYDHFPLGWLQIGLWQKLTGGPFTFGMSAFSGRLFTIILVSLSSCLVYGITKKLTNNFKIALFSTLIFILSPMATYHRQVLLDNIATFWVLLSSYKLITADGKIKNFLLAGLFAGIAFLSKESTVFFMPALIVISVITSHKNNRAFSIFLFFFTFVSLTALLPILAFLKGELLPDTWLGTEPHVSLIGTVFYQAARGNSLPFWSPNSDFLFNLKGWASQDFFLIAIGLWSLFTTLVFGNKTIRAFGLLGICYLLFLIRGGVVLNFYIIPMLPFLAIGVGLLLDQILSFMPGIKKLFDTKAGYLLVCLVLSYLVFDQDLFFLDATSNQRIMIEDIKKNTTPNSTIISDFTPWVDLRLSRFPGDPAFPNIEWFYKTDLDPEIRDKKLNNDYRNVDYLILSDEIVHELSSGKYPLVKEVLSNSKVSKDYPPTVPKASRDIEHLVSTDNSWATIYKTVKPESSFGKLIQTIPSIPTTR